MTDQNIPSNERVTLLDALDRCGCCDCGQMAEEAATEIRRLQSIIRGKTFVTGSPSETSARLPEGFALYRRIGSILARPWTQQDAADYLNGLHGNVSVSDADKHTACVAQGMLAMNPDNSFDCWYIAPDYFAKHYDARSPENGSGDSK